MGFYEDLLQRIGPVQSTANSMSNLNQSINTFANTMNTNAQSILEQNRQRIEQNRLANKDEQDTTIFDMKVEAYNKAKNLEEKTRQTLTGPNTGATGLAPELELAINDKYSQLSNKWAGKNVEMPNTYMLDATGKPQLDAVGKPLVNPNVAQPSADALAYSAELDALNKGLITDLGTEADGTVRNTLGSFKDIQAKLANDLMQIPGMTYTDAQTMATAKANEIRPQMTAEQVKRQQEMNDAILKIETKGIGTQGTNNIVVNTGFGGSNPDLTQSVVSNNLNPTLLADTIKDLATNTSFSGRRTEDLGGDLMALSGRLNTIATGIKALATKDGRPMSDAAVSTALRNLVSTDNPWRDNTLKGSIADTTLEGYKLALVAGQTASTVRDTFKAPTIKGGDGVSAAEAEAKLQQATLNYAAREAALNAMSNPNQQITKADLKTFFGPEAVKIAAKQKVEAAKKAEKVVKTITGGNKKPTGETPEIDNWVASKETVKEAAKIPKVEVTTETKSLFTDNDPISTAMSEGTSLLAVSGKYPKEFKAKFATFTPAQRKEVQVRLTKEIGSKLNVKETPVNPPKDPNILTNPIDWYNNTKVIDDTAEQGIQDLKDELVKDPYMPGYAKAGNYAKQVGYAGLSMLGDAGRGIASGVSNARNMFENAVVNRGDQPTTAMPTEEVVDKFNVTNPFLWLKNQTKNVVNRQFKGSNSLGEATQNEQPLYTPKDVITVARDFSKSRSKFGAPTKLVLGGGNAEISPVAPEAAEAYTLRKAITDYSTEATPSDPVLANKIKTVTPVVRQVLRSAGIPNPNPLALIAVTTAMLTEGSPLNLAAAAGDRAAYNKAVLDIVNTEATPSLR